MTREEKQLLLKDLCARLPYGVIIEITSWGGMVGASYDMRLDAGLLADLLHSEDDFKPYLRPLSSMTEEERKELSKILNYEFYTDDDFALAAEDDRHRIRLELCEGYVDWLNAHHFDYRGLIEKGLALEAPEEMYKQD